MNPKDLAALIVLGAIWGGSFLFIRVAVPEMGPLLLMLLRVGLAALVLLPFVIALGVIRELRAWWRPFLVIGLLNAAIPFSLIALAEVRLTASLAAILNSTTVLFAALVAAVWLGEPFTTRKVSGVILGIVGVAVLVGLDPIPLDGAVALSVGAMLLAAFFYAVSGTYIKKTFSGVRPLAMAAGQQTGAAAILLFPAVATMPAQVPSPTAGLSALALAWLCTAAAYLLYFRLMESVGPTSTLTVTFLAPGFGVLFGVLLLDEPFGLGTLAGLLTILLSVALVTGIPLGPSTRKARG